MFKSELKSRIGEDISLLVKLDNHPWNYLCECGDASDLTVKEVQNTNAIFISHTHIDHFVNFDAVIRHQIGIQRRVIICGPKGIAQQIQSRIKSYTWNLIKKDAIIYEIRELISENEIITYEIEPPVWELKKVNQTVGNTILQEKTFKVTAILLDHKIPTLAYKFKENDVLKIDIKASGFKGGKWVKELKDAFENNQSENIQEGDSVGIIMDHAANEENHSKIIAHFSNCKKVFIESFYKEEDKELAEVNFHSYSTMSGKVMRESNVKEAIPVHFSRKYQESEIEELTEEFNRAVASI